jgi:hypothetical protein
VYLITFFKNKNKNKKNKEYKREKLEPPPQKKREKKGKKNKLIQYKKCQLKISIKGVKGFSKK